MFPKGRRLLVLEKGLEEMPGHQSNVSAAQGPEAGERGRAPRCENWGAGTPEAEVTLGMKGQDRSSFHFPCLEPKRGAGWNVSSSNDWTPPQGASRASRSRRYHVLIFKEQWQLHSRCELVRASGSEIAPKLKAHSFKATPLPLAKRQIH